MAVFLRSEWDRCEQLENAIQPHMRMVHGFLSNSLKKNNMAPFRTIKEEKRGRQSKYPKTEAVWKGMTRHPKYARHQSKENRVLTIPEDSLLRHAATDMHKEDEVEIQLILRSNIDASHRKKDIKDLDYRYASFENKKVNSRM